MTPTSIVAQTKVSSGRGDDDDDNSSVWCLVEIDRTQVEAKDIVHIGRGRFKVVEDKSGGAFINRVIDESDISSIAEVNDVPK